MCVFVIIISIFNVKSATALDILFDYKLNRMVALEDMTYDSAVKYLLDFFVRSIGHFR